jgi:hypothetical protein
MPRDHGRAAFLKLKPTGGPMNLKHKLAITAFVALAAPGIAVAIRAAAGVVDFSFSLECRGLENQMGKDILLPWLTAVTDWEREHPWANEQPNPWNVAHYDTGFLIAFNHGLPDDNSAYDVDKLRVVEVTPNGITLRGTTDDGDEEQGFFDRRTGHGMITWHKPGNRLFRQFIMECEPSKPGKF